MKLFLFFAVLMTGLAAKATQRECTIVASHRTAEGFKSHIESKPLAFSDDQAMGLVHAEFLKNDQGFNSVQLDYYFDGHGQVFMEFTFFDTDQAPLGSLILHPSEESEESYGGVRLYKTQDINKDYTEFIAYCMPKI